jgi:Ras-related protein Rab-1A
MSEEDYDFIFKVLLLGNSDVGKSSLILRYVDGTWSNTFIPTIGVDFKVKTIEVDNKKIKMQIWDTAGQERFRTVIASYFKGSHGVLLIYDVTNKTSFKQLESWLEIIENNASEDILKILIGNKIDLEEDREVTKEEGQSFANQHNIQFMETSAKMNTNVNEAFEALAKIMMEYNVNQKVKATKNDKTVKVSSGKNLSTKKKCC